MSPHDRLDRQIESLSDGRLTFDPRLKRLTAHDGDGVLRADVDIAETELRGLLQRLLLATPQPLDGEPIAVAVRLLLAHLDERV